ncbi:MAG: nicotinamide mononucleotide transporter [Ruminococcaceae bacterium]|nr:nicotinamide mononucleotide transporter [Oscillospiraceae bacterium]
MKIQNPFRDLSKFEFILWIISVTVVTGSFLLVPVKDYLTLWASLIGVTALIFVAKGYVLGQVLTLIFAVFYGAISYHFTYYGEMITYLCMTAPIALASIVTWVRNPYKGSREVKVAHMGKMHIAIMWMLAFIVTAIFYFILKALGNANLLFSTISITTSFLASYLTMMRNPFYAIAYGANDIVLIVLWILATIENHAYFPMIICFVMFLINDVYGFINWQRMKKRQQA